MSALFRNARQVALRLQARNSSDSAVMDYRAKIGAREVVGFGFNGQPNYMDRIDFPLPAVRWRPETPEIKELRQKEKGDWKNLTIAEKKALYRASFCQTLAEVEAPTGEWKSIVGWSLVVMSLPIWLYMFMKVFVYGPLPVTFSEENKKAQLERMIELQINPIEGVASKYPRPQ
ncbi:cytochrome C oxidase [Nesidiocoris tenuis]|uniref:Cytochrome c oxidase subunit 4 n=1 Tax=Nesidiocoris tenuis TaxID=355587 RepID=A0ABN7B7M2_9HEMI|nr:cytochrome C oxidase [Nesidiocoris tenuis]